MDEKISRSKIRNGIAGWLHQAADVWEMNKYASGALHKKADEVAHLETANAELLEALENLSGAVHAVGYDTVSIIHPALLNANEAIRKHKGE